jgi:hypothetical protein
MLSFLSTLSVGTPTTCIATVHATALDCLKLASPVENEPEDTFYTDRVRQLRGAIPDVYTAARFSVETAYVGHPLGVHGTDKYLHPLEIAERIVRAVEY